MIRFHPKLLDTLPGYSRGIFASDLSAGITVGVLALPLATLSAIVVMVSINMGEWHALKWGELKRFSNDYRIILLGTFFSCSPWCST